MRKQFAALAAASLILAAPSAAQASGFRSSPERTRATVSYFQWTFEGRVGITSRAIKTHKTGDIKIVSQARSCPVVKGIPYTYYVTLYRKGFLGLPRDQGYEKITCGGLSTWHNRPKGTYRFVITVDQRWHERAKNAIDGTTSYR